MTIIEPANEDRSRLERAVDKALNIQTPMVESHVSRLRRNRPQGSPGDIVRALEKQYLSAVTASGAAVGAAAAVPAVGTGAALAMAGGEMVTTLNATMLYLLGLTKLHGVSLQDLERRRTLLYAVLLGDSGAGTVHKIAERTGQHWGKKVAESVPLETIRQINRVLGRNFVTRYGTKQGIVVLGKVAPLGIGAGIGATSNFVIGRTTVAAARRAFGPAPATFAGQPSD